MGKPKDSAAYVLLAFWALIAGAFAASVAVLAFGCASPTVQAKRAVIGVSYADEVNTCSDKAVDAGSQAAYDACMDDVDTRYGLRKAADGGAK